jgi:hypothetical protein
MEISGMEIARISLGFYTRKMSASEVDAAQKWDLEAISPATALPIYITSISPVREV